MSFKEKQQPMKTKPSNSLNDGGLKQFAQPYTNESGDENSNDKMTASTASNYTDYKRSKTNKSENQQDLSMTMDSIKVDSDKITFIAEKDFKFEKNCWVCKIMFGKINERQHHCRLCAHSVCKVCSGKKVNENRVCDICFLKMKNVKGEKRKKKLLAAMKNFIKNLSSNIQKGSEENKKLEQKKRILKDQANAEEENRQYELKLLQLKLEEIERSKSNMEKQIKQQEDQMQIKKIERQVVQDKVNECQIKTKNITNDIMISNEAYRSREEQIKQLYQQKKDLQNQESFVRLPNYQRAKNNDPENVCEAIIFLDSNDQRNGINHYNTVSNNNVFQSTMDSQPIEKPIEKQPNQSSQQKKSDRDNLKSDYAASYNQGLVEDSEIIQHQTRSNKKQKKGTGKGCLCN